MTSRPLCCREDEAQAARGAGGRTTKTVVFSYSTKALDLLQSPLRVQGCELMFKVEVCM